MLHLKERATVSPCVAAVAHIFQLLLSYQLRQDYASCVDFTGPAVSEEVGLDRLNMPCGGHSEGALRVIVMVSQFEV